MLGKFLGVMTLTVLAIICLELSLIPQARAKGAFPYRFNSSGQSDGYGLNTVVGFPVKYRIKGDESLLEVAKSHDLGYYELHDLYPDVDPWIPPEGMEILLPTQWILPVVKRSTIVINIPEYRLYYFMPSIKMVKTYPVGLGKKSWPTPVGTFQIGEKRKDPTWYIPKSLQKKHGQKTVPPGPDNPLGKYWLGLGASGCGLHGSNIIWSIGRPVTHGCIRLYPKDIKELYNLIDIGTSVEIIYEPVKIGFCNGNIFLEVHKDIYQRIEDLFDYTYQKLKDKDLFGQVNMELVSNALSRQDGLPVIISRDLQEKIFSANRESSQDSQSR